MKRLLLATCLLAVLRTAASAQVAASFDASDATEPVSVVEGPGIKVGEGTVVHPVVGVETGFVSNVFFAAGDVQPAGLLRLLAQAGLGSLGKKRLSSATVVDPNPLTAGETEGGRVETVDNQGLFQYRADLRLSYDFLLSGNRYVSAQGGLGAGALVRGIVYPQSTVSFAFLENFERIIRATNFESEANLNRIRNHLNLRLNIAPKGRTLSALIRYDNLIDYFEADTQHFANRLQHSFGVRGMWQWLPVTRLYADARIGIFTGLGDSTKVDSYPVVVEAGLQTLLTLNTTLIARIGYTNGFYASGPSFSAPAAGAQLGYRYSPLGRVTLGYDYVNTDSINANYYRDHVIRATIEQGFVPFVLTARPELHVRQYNGVTVPGASSPVRNDLILAAIVGAHYNFRNWIAATIDYNLALVSTDFRYMPEPGLIDDPSYVRHEILVGVRAAL